MSATNVMENYIPKDATQQSLFFQKYPEFDGRGIKIAIIDTDVADISLPGLQKTSTGLPKIIDIFPRTGITVNTSKVTKTTETGHIIGLSGRKIQISTNWENVNDKWHLGSLPLNDLLDLKMPGTEYLELKKGLVKALKQEILDSKKNEIIDCIVWFDGEKWRAFIDNTFVSDNSNSVDAKALTNFNDEHEVAHFLKNVFYCVNISEDGESLEIFRPVHCHGTTVTQVAAGYFPDNPEGSGLAPGAQIVSMNWDVENLHKMLLKCIELKVDILNFSCNFEAETYVRLQKLFNLMVEEHGIIITKIGGNQGPFYSTIPEQYSIISEQMFIIGSIFTADQLKMKELFGYNEKVNEVQNYSSKGPLTSGARGIDFVSPGTAVLDLPKWYPIKNRHQYGTSLAAPNVAGSTACLLSALKANGIPYSPAMIKMALANTAFLPEGADKLAFGHGIIQIYDAFEFIKKSFNILPMKSLAPISIDQFGQNGILHVQNKYKLPQEYRYYLNFEPEMDYIKWILKCNSSVEKFISYSKIGNFFIVKIDTTFLKEGSINYAEIHGIDSLNPSIGPLFYLPITVICPADPNNFNKEITVNPGSPTCFFFQSPSKPQKFDIEITLLEEEEYEKENKIPKMHQQKKKESIRSKNAIKINPKKKTTTVSTVKIRSEKEITMKYCRKKVISMIRNSLDAKHIFKFSEKKKTQTTSIRVGDDEDPLEIRFFHTNSDSLKLKLEISSEKLGS